MARTPPPPPERPSLTPLYLILGLVAVVGVGVLAFQAFAKPKAVAAPVAVATDPQALSAVRGISKGSPDAPVEILEFADYQCPHCAEFSSFVEPVIEDRYVKRGLVRYTFYDFPLGSFPNSFLAARAARCANEQGKFWEYHDLLYARQPTWGSERDPTGSMVDYAAQLGLDRSGFQRCLRSDRFAKEVSESRALGESLGVQGTPTLFVNGKRLPSVPSLPELEQVIRENAGLAPVTRDSAAASGAAG